MVLFLVLALATTLLVSPARADLYDPVCCDTSLDTIQRLLLIPDENGLDPHPAGSFTVRIRNMACNPVPGVVVTVEIAGLDEGKARLCGGAETSAVTDNDGIVRMNISGGGCYKGPHAVTIKGNDVVIRVFQAVVSPDYAGSDNQGIAGRSDLRVTVADFANFAQAWWNAVGSSCHDYNNSGAMDAADFSVFSQVWNGGNRDCAP